MFREAYQRFMIMRFTNPMAFYGIIAAVVVLVAVIGMKMTKQAGNAVRQIARLAQAAGASDDFVGGLYSKAKSLDDKGDGGTLFNMTTDYKVFNKATGKYEDDQDYKYEGKRGNEVFSSLFVDVDEKPAPEDKTVSQTLVSQAAKMTSMHNMRQSSLLL